MSDQNQADNAENRPLEKDAQVDQSQTQDNAAEAGGGEDAGILVIQTPDEAQFRRRNGSYHKLLEHDGTTGLLTDSGLQSYAHLLAGLKLNDPNGDFNQTELNNVRLAVPPNPGNKRRIFINPQSSKSLTVQGKETSDVKNYEVITKFHQEATSDTATSGGRYNFGYVNYATESDLLKALSFTSQETAAEMLECYLMALVRDELFGNYKNTPPLVQLAIDALNEFDRKANPANEKPQNYAFKGPKEKVKEKFGNREVEVYRVTPKTLFRGNSPGDLKGEYLSKFLLKSRPPLFPSGCAPNVANLTNANIFFNTFRRYLYVPKPNPLSEWGLTWKDFVDLQNGKIPRPYDENDFFAFWVFADNGRRMGSLVHVDGFYEESIWAVDILTAGNYPRTEVSPYTGDPPLAPNEGDGLTLGIPDAASLVGAVALSAGRAAWRQKWVATRRGRPEAMGGLIHQLRKTGDTGIYGNLDMRLRSTDGRIGRAFDNIKSRNRRLGGSDDAATHLLPQLFPEGSPSHPAWTSGHATVHGACVTVIKAIFNDKAPLRDDEGGYYTDPETGERLTVGGELDKLASNVALGRSFAGVHFRSDGEHGILIGEAIAIQFLQNHLKTYKEKFRGGDPSFVITNRAGKRIRITPTGTRELTADEVRREAPVSEVADEGPIVL